MTTKHPIAVTFEHILVPTDYSEVSQRALDYAKTIARQGNSELLLVHVNQPVEFVTPPVAAAWAELPQIQALQEERLEHISARLRSEGYRSRAISLLGPLYDELLHAVKQYKVDLIVLGTHGKKGLERFLLGSDAEALLRQAHCPVLSVGPAVPALQGKPWSIREVICATTLKPSSAETVAYAHKLAAQQGAEVVLLHVKEGKNEEEVDWMAFEDAFHYHAPEHLGKGTWLRTRLTSAAPGVSIVELAKERGSDLIVMGAHPASSVATHLAPGNAAQVLLEAPCPVLTLLKP
jgi:nucleotide-binding universal stress UspA family protein